MKQTSKMVRQLSNYSCQQVVLKSCRSKYSAQETSQKLCKRGLELVKIRLLSTIQPQRDLLLKRHKHMICKYPFSPKERFLKEPHRGVPLVWVLSFLYLIYSPKIEFSLGTTRGVSLVWVLSLPYIIPQRRVPLRNDPRGLIGLSALFTLYYSPKQSSL